MTAFRIRSKPIYGLAVHNLRNMSYLSGSSTRFTKSRFADGIAIAQTRSMIMTHSLPAPVYRILLCSIFLLSMLPASAVVAQINQATCVSNTEEAESQIANGFFDEAIELLIVCEDAEFLSTPEQARIIKLLADAYLAKRFESEARDAIAKLLDVSPNFTPDANLDSQVFRDLVAELRAERQAPPKPTDLSAAIENGDVVLSWTRLDDDTVAGILILRAEVTNTLAQLDSVSATATGYTDSRAEPGTSYYYSIQAVGTNGVPGERHDVQRVTMPALPAEDPEIAVADTPEKSSNKKWVFIGGGVAAAGALAAILLSGGDDGGGGVVIPPEGDPLPGPPGIP